MLYTALHDVAQTIALVVDKKSFDNIEIYIGARDFSGDDFVASKLLENSIHGFLPGVNVYYDRDKSLFHDKNVNRYVASYSGVASLCDDKKKLLFKDLKNLLMQRLQYLHLLPFYS